MNPLLAAGDVVSHLSDYRFGTPWFTAHHALLIMTGAGMIALFWYVAGTVTTQPKRSGLAALIEVGLIFVRDDIVYPWLGEKRGRAFVPFFWTLFFFILLSNLFGLFPFPLNPWHRTTTGNWNVTGALAVVAFVVIQVSGMRKHGYKNYWIHLVPGGVPLLLWPIVWLIEFIGLFTKPFALMVRLFANMTAGHAIVAVLIGFLWLPGKSLATGVPATAASFAFMLFIMLFETLVALIQAYIFTVLTAIFTSLAVAEEH